MLKSIEYDRFGPWIYEINNVDTIPELFLPYITDDNEDEGEIFRIKIPRRIERRNATADMDLYDFLISLQDKQIQILQRGDEIVKEKKIPYKEIKALKIQESLLKGILGIYLKENEIQISYNTVSNEIILKLVKLIRDKYTTKNTKSFNLIEADSEISDFFFQGLYNRIKTNYSQEKLINFQKEISFSETGDTLIKRFVNKIIKKSLQPHICFFNDCELTIVKRIKNYLTRFDSQYGFEELHIPLESIKKIEWNDDKQHEEIINEILILDNQKIVIPFSRDSKGISKIQSLFSS